MRKFAIGDVHGRMDKLEDLMKKVSPEEDDTFIFLGDYIDRGPHSKEVVDYLLELRKTSKCIFLTGNHEQMLYDYLTPPREDSLYLRNGGASTIESYVKEDKTLNSFLLSTMSKKLSSDEYYKQLKVARSKRFQAFVRSLKSHADFFDNLAWYHEDDDYIYVHAGVRAGIELEKQNRDYLIWARGEFIYLDTGRSKKVIYGHTPRDIPHVMRDKIGIDTGAFDPSGMLTAIQLPEETFIHSFRG